MNELETDTGEWRLIRPMPDDPFQMAVHKTFERVNMLCLVADRLESWTGTSHSFLSGKEQCFGRKTKKIVH